MCRITEGVGLTRCRIIKITVVGKEKCKDFNRVAYDHGKMIEIPVNINRKKRIEKIYCANHCCSTITISKV